ncbi:TetR/AcrR family transcriptional regulator [Tessaracoccus antarcticus]|uniref:TetR/AcrR family transcriptional regulator n=1 Tax=Tessaracoccus antarcticus TaxID=2479848 RepID=A0A3M0GB38_9ACTN|nr:TetR/AcrR family transcriptional regulator [Tessaracoccus antarcticus]RMB58793.1 TetR/AcrR family transcriptional regulator [Tessaracoccus antarcticus]
MSARIAEFADVALGIVAREGLPALSFRAVAAESGWSLGAVQKAFASKEELLHAALDRAQAQVNSSVSAEPAKPTLERWLVGLILATLPLDAQRRAAVVVGVAFADRAPFDDRIAEAIRTSDEGIRAQLVRLFAWRRAEGELVARLDDEALARLVLAFSAGLAAQLLYDPQPAQDVEKLVADVIGAALH